MASNVIIYQHRSIPVTSKSEPEAPKPERQIARLLLATRCKSLTMLFYALPCCGDPPRVACVHKRQHSCCGLEIGSTRHLFLNPHSSCSMCLLHHMQMLTKAGCFKQNVGCSAEQFAHDEQGCQQTSRHICCTWTGLLPE